MTDETLNHSGVSVNPEDVLGPVNSTISAEPSDAESLYSDEDALLGGFVEVGSPEASSVESKEAAFADLPDQSVQSDPTHEEDLVIDLGEISRMIPNKMAFKIGEVAEITGLKTYVLRYWESEFEALNPQKSAFNQRMYSRRDVETVLLIKKLLYEEKFSIAGAKRKLKEVRRELKSEKQMVEVAGKLDSAADKLEELIEEIGHLKSLFS